MDFLVRRFNETENRTYAHRIKHRVDAILELKDDFEPFCDPDVVVITGVCLRGPVAHFDEELAVMSSSAGLVARGEHHCHGLSWYTCIPWLRLIGAPHCFAEMYDLESAVWKQKDDKVRKVLFDTHRLMRRVNQRWSDADTVYASFCRTAGDVVAAAIRSHELGHSLRISPEFRYVWSGVVEDHTRCDALRRSSANTERKVGFTKRKCSTFRDCTTAAVKECENPDALVVIEAPCAVTDVCTTLLIDHPSATVITQRGEFTKGLGGGRHFDKDHRAAGLDIAVYVTDHSPRIHMFDPETAKKTILVTTNPAVNITRDHGKVVVWLVAPTLDCAEWLSAAERQPRDHRCNGMAKYIKDGVKIHYTGLCKCDAAALRSTADLLLDDAAVPYGLKANVLAGSFSGRNVRLARRTKFVICHFFSDEL